MRNNLYNISKLDLEYSQQKIDNQKNYLSNNTFMTNNGEFKTLLDVSMSANISSRYYAQLANKVNTLQQVMQNEDLTPVFLTITLDGVYHDLLYGDYSRFSLKHQRKLPNNETNGFLQLKASNHEFFTSRDLYQIIRYQWRSFQSSWSFRDMKKEGHKVGYLFSVEPHKSGVPHAHVLLYIPQSYIQPLKKQFINKFWAKQNISQDRNRLSPDQIKNGEINGFQWTLSNPVGYVMKYCTKSFIDIKNQAKLDELQAWYIKNKIIRITMSHTLVPQWVYNKIYPLEKDWLYLSLLNLSSSCEWSREQDYFSFTDSNLKKEFRYERGLYQMFIRGKLVHEFGVQKEKSIIKSFKVEQKPTLKSKFKKSKPLVTFNNEVYILTDKGLIKQVPIISKMKSLQLYDYYLTLNPDSSDTQLQHYALVKNELINRGLLHEQLQSINDYNTNFPTYNQTNQIQKIVVKK